MNKLIPFFKTVWLALNPWRYGELKEKTSWMLMKYFFSFVLLAFIAAVVLMLPTIAGFVSTQMSHFDRLEVKFNTSMNSAIVFPERDPFVTLDTRKSEGTLKEGRILITDDNLYYKMPLSKVKKEAVGGYKDLVANEEILMTLVLLMLPSILFLFYLLYAIKIFLFILLATLVCFVIIRLVKFDASFSEIFRTGLLAATPMIIIDLIRLPFGLNLYYAQYIAFFIFFIVGVIKVGDFEGMRHSKKKGKHGHYVDMTKKI
ncbi:MAG: hypothetical protein ABIA62_05185 [Candidatus Woesearchaeota archaeon]